jgi:alkylated DNA repair dioxygenase AlkB
MNESYLNERVLISRSFFSLVEANHLFNRLLDEIKWLDKAYQNKDGSVVHLPRLTANYGEKSYNYSGLVFKPEPWTDLLLSLKNTAEKLSNQVFNALVLQQYRDGKDKVNWHSDDEAGVGENPTIVSMSFGESRQFWLKPKGISEEILKLNLHNGDVLIMQGDLQHSYLHKVPTEADKQTRINLTFRKIID